jgi:hypothetical protein
MVGSNKTRNGSPNKVWVCLAEALDDSYVCSGYIFPQGNRAPLLCYITMGRVTHATYARFPSINSSVARRSHSQIGHQRNKSLAARHLVGWHKATIGALATHSSPDSQSCTRPRVAASASSGGVDAAPPIVVAVAIATQGIASIAAIRIARRRPLSHGWTGSWVPTQTHLGTASSHCWTTSP